jgi:hypothetical protein
MRGPCMLSSCNLPVQDAIEVLVAVSHIPRIPINSDRDLIINYDSGTADATANLDSSSFTYSIISTALLFAAEQSKRRTYN